MLRRQMSTPVFLRLLNIRKSIAVTSALLAGAVVMLCPTLHAQGTAGSVTSFSFVQVNPKTGATTPITNNTAAFGTLIYQNMQVSAATGSGIPSGIVKMFANGSPYDGGQLTLDAQGQAVDKVFNPLPGNYAISVQYQGDSTFAPSSAGGSFTITAAVPTVTITASQSTVAQGTPITLTAVVDSTSSYAGPTGTVTFFSGSTQLGPATPLVTGTDSNGFPNGTAILTTIALPAGSNSVTAHYNGDSEKGEFAAATSSGLSVSVTAASPQQFIPVTPCRIADTRNSDGPFGGPEMAGGSSREFEIPKSSCNIPSSAVAYSLNVTVVPDAVLHYLTLWPSGQTQPLVSTLNSDGRVKANAAIVPAGTNGGVSIFVTDSTHVIIDINGYFVPAGTSSALQFYPVSPCRVVDTRNANGSLGGPFLPGNNSRSFPVQSSSCGLPSTAQAYSFNVTAVPHNILHYLSTWPTGQTQPLVSTLNSSTGAVTANGAIVPAGTDGAITIYVTDDSDVVLDVNGYFAPKASGGLSLYTLTPCRVTDTRLTTGAFTGSTTVTVPGTICAPPSSAKAYVFNATVVPSGALNYLTLWPNSENQPLVSTLNASDGAVTSNMAIVPNTDGVVGAFANGSTNLVLDISSYFAP